MAANKGNYGVLAVLIEAGAGINRRALDGCTPLHTACLNGVYTAVLIVYIGLVDLWLVEGGSGMKEKI